MLNIFGYNAYVYLSAVLSHPVSFAVYSVWRPVQNVLPR